MVTSRATARRSRLRSMLAVTALSGVIAGSIFAANPAYALFDGEGRHVRGVGAESAEGFWLGAYAPPGNVEQGYPVWCTHMWRANPQPHHTATIATLTESKMWGTDDLDATTPQMAWILNKYQADPSATNRGALSYLIHANFEGEQPGRSTQASVDLLIRQVKEQANDVHALAARYVAEAKNSAAVGYEGGSVEGDGKREGTFNNIGVRTANGWAAGVPVTITLEGSAIFKETGTNTWSGTTASTPLTLEWVATGNGEVVSKIKFPQNVRRTLTKYGVDGSIQDTLSYGNRPGIGDPESVTVPGARWRVIFDFQPIATSNVGSAKVVDGNTISDTLVAKADPAYGDGQWLEVDGAPVPVTYVGKAYRTGDLPAEETENVPAGVEPIATTSLTFNGAGEQSATVDVPAGVDPGFITWVWSVDKDSHGENAKYIHANWQDKYGLADETTSRRFPVEVNTAISARETKNGYYFHDDIWVDGFPENHGDWAGSHNFKADVKNMDQSLFFFPEDLEVVEANKDKAELIAKVNVPAKNGFYPSVGSTKFKAKDGNPAGTYVFVTSFAGDDRVAPFTTSVEDKTEQFSVAGEIPTLKTTATDKADGDKTLPAHGSVTIEDKVCYTALKPGKEYVLSGVLMDKTTGKPLSADGKEITASKTFTPQAANGCEMVDFVVDAKHLAGKTTVVFESLTREGKQIAIHADINDEGQTIPSPGAPTLKTTATDKADGDKVLAAAANVTISDKVCYTNLVAGKQYTLEGKLMDKATAQPLMVDGKEVVSSKTFTAPAANGCETVDFTLNASTLAGKKTVVFEKATHEGKEVAIHADINDDGQTVEFADNPKLAKTGAGNIAAWLLGSLALAGLGAGALYRQRMNG